MKQKRLFWSTAQARRNHSQYIGEIIMRVNCEQVCIFIKYLWKNAYF